MKLHFSVFLSAIVFPQKDDWNIYNEKSFSYCCFMYFFNAFNIKYLLVVAPPAYELPSQLSGMVGAGLSSCCHLITKL